MLTELLNPIPMSSWLIESRLVAMPLHQQALSRKVLADHHVDLVKPPEGELDRTTEKPNNTHHVLVHVLNPISRLKTINSSCGLLKLLLDSFFQPLHHRFLSISPFFISNPRYLYVASSSRGCPGETGRGVSTFSWMAPFLLLTTIPTEAAHLFSLVDLHCFLETFT